MVVLNGVDYEIIYVEPKIINFPDPVKVCFLWKLVNY